MIGWLASVAVVGGLAYLLGPFWFFVVFVVFVAITPDLLRR